MTIKDAVINAFMYFGLCNLQNRPSNDMLEKSVSAWCLALADLTPEEIQAAATAWTRVPEQIGRAHV